MNSQLSFLMPGRKASRLIVAAVAVLFITSCGDDDDDDNNGGGESVEGTSSFVISGSQEGNAVGNASWRNSQIGTATDAFRATLTMGAPGFGTVIFNSDILDELMEIETGRVYVLGTFGDVDAGDADFYVSYTVSDDPWGFPAEVVGTLEFSATSSQKVEGVFEFSLTTVDNPNAGGERSITVTEGVFSAVVI